MMKAWDEMIVACLTDAPDARELVERVLAEFGSWNDPEGYMTNGIVLSRLGSDEMALRLLRDAVDGGFHVPPTPWPTIRGWRRCATTRASARSCRRRRRARREALAVFRAEGGERLLGLRAAA